MGKSQTIGIDDLIDDVFPTENINQSPSVQENNGMDDLIDDVFGTPGVQPAIETPSAVPQPVQQPKIPVAMNQWGFEQPIGISTEEPELQSPLLSTIQTVAEPLERLDQKRVQFVNKQIAENRERFGKVPRIDEFATMLEAYRKMTGKDSIDIPVTTTEFEQFMRTGRHLQYQNVQDIRNQLSKMYANGEIPTPENIKDKLGEELGQVVLDHLYELSPRLIDPKASWKWRGEKQSIIPAEIIMRHPYLAAAVDEAGLQAYNLLKDQLTDPKEWALDFVAGKWFIAPVGAYMKRTGLFQALENIGKWRNVSKITKMDSSTLKKAMTADMRNLGVANEIVSQLNNMADDEVLALGQALRDGKKVSLYVPGHHVKNLGPNWKPVKPTPEGLDIEAKFNEPISTAKQPIAPITDTEAVSGLKPMPRTGKLIPERIIGQRTTGGPEPGQEFVPQGAIDVEGRVQFKPTERPASVNEGLAVPQRKISTAVSRPVDVGEEYIPTESIRYPGIEEDKAFRQEARALASSLYQQNKIELQELSKKAREILDHGGLKPYKGGLQFEEFNEVVPTYLRRKTGKPPDEMASELDMEGDAELFETIRKIEDARKSAKSKRVMDFLPQAEAILKKQQGYQVSPEGQLVEGVYPGQIIEPGEIRAGSRGGIQPGVGPPLIRPEQGEIPVATRPTEAIMPGGQRIVPSGETVSGIGSQPLIQPRPQGAITPTTETILPKQTKSMERGVVPEPGFKPVTQQAAIPESQAISIPKDKTLLKNLGFDENKINALSPDDAARISQKGLSADDVYVDKDGTAVDKTPPQGNLDRYEKLTEGDFIDDSPPIGQGIRRVIPPGVEVYKPPKDLKGLQGWFENWIEPVRTIATKDPVANRIAHSGRNTVENMAIEISHFTGRIDDAYRKIPKKEWHIISQYMEKKLDPANIPLRLKGTYDELSQIRSELYDIIVHQMGIDTSKWKIPLDAYWPHVFVGDYQITLNGKTIPGGFAKTLDEALDIVSDYMKANPSATGFQIAPKEIASDFTTTMLSRRGYFKLINSITDAIEDATTLGNEEIMGLMKGVAAIKPRPKFVGNFKERISNLGGYIEGPDAIKIYASRVLRKKYIDPFQKNAMDLATQLPQGLRTYFEDYIQTISGKFNPFDNSYTMRKVLPFVTRNQARLKLGYRPATALMNRLQPTQLAYPEIGNYLWRGWFAKHQQWMKDILTESGIYGELPSYTGAGYTSRIPGKQGFRELFHPLGMFAKAEIANREDVISGGYLFAQKVFGMDRAKAENMGYKYILDYLDNIGDPKIAALQYAKDLNADVNFIFTNADLPKIMRGGVGKTALQFKAFPINFLATTLKWTGEAMKHPTPHNMARMLRLGSANLLLGGVRAVPYAGRKAWRALIMSSLALPFMAGLSEDNRNYAKEVLGRGIFSLFGIDMSRKVGPNEFLPKETRDFLGPLASDIYNVVQFSRGDKDWKSLLYTMPQLRDIYMAFGELGAEQIGLGEAPDFIADPNKRMRKITEITGWDRAFRALGLPIEKVEITKDIAAIAAEISKDYSKNKAKYVDKFISGLSGNKPNKSMDAWTDALNNGIFISFEDVFGELSAKNNPQLIRILKNMPLPTRMEYFDMVDKGQSVTDLLYKRSGIKK